MNIDQRKIIFKKLSQQLPSSSTQTSNQQTPLGDVRTILPNVKSYLFDGTSWQSINLIMNTINKAIQQLSNNSMSVKSVIVSNPNSGSSEFAGSITNLILIVRWFYSTLTVDRKNVPYTKANVKKVINDLISTISSKSFPEPGSDKIKTSIVDAAKAWAAKVT